MDVQRLVTTIIIILIIMIVYYFSTWQRRKEQKELRKLQNGIKEGDKIITYSGLSGLVDERKEDRIIVSLHPSKQKVSIEKWAVAGLDERDIN